jgi:hypothetical protein
MKLLLLFFLGMSLLHLLAIGIKFGYSFKTMEPFQLSIFERIGLYASLAYIFAFIFV